MVYSHKISDEQKRNRLNSKLTSLIYGEREEDLDGIQRSNYRSLGGWHSHNNLHKERDYKPLIKEINSICSFISKQCGYDPAYELRIGTMWSIINGPGSWNKNHVHPGSLWSGVYYVQSPKDSGNIEFTDPRVVSVMSQPRFENGRKRPQQCWSKVNFTPQAGKFLVFPSWLYHSVAPNLSSDSHPPNNDRIIISFNLSQQKK